MNSKFQNILDEEPVKSKILLFDFINSSNFNLLIDLISADVDDE